MLQPGETTGPVGLWDQSGKMLDAHSTVRRLLHDMREAAVGRNFGHFDHLSEDLEAFTAPYLAPAQEVNWSGCNLTPSQTVIADLLLSKLGKVVPKSSILNALYFNKVEEADVKIIDIFLCHLRKRIKNTPYRIDTVFGTGLRMVKKQEAIAA